MSLEHTEKPSLVGAHFSSHKGEKWAEDDVIVLAQAYRWKIMGAIALLLLGLVMYLYHTKVGEPVERLESDIRPQVTSSPELCGGRTCREAN